MIMEEPPFIEVGADVSAKFKGAFCEATVKSAKKLVKCKVLLKNGTSCVANDENIEGPLKLNALVKVKQQENEYSDGTIIKMTDNSLYTVVFDDGDEKTLRRTSLCLKGERHFHEDENLDNRPLNNPENFGAPVSRREKSRKRTRLSSQNSFDEAELEEELSSVAKKKRESSFGKVFCIELGERRKSWFPALCLRKSMADGMTMEKDQVLVQSFKDGKKICVNKSDMKEFSKDKEPLLSYMRGDTKIEPILRAAIEKALIFYDHGELPRGWQVDLTDTTESSEEEEEEGIDEDSKPSPEEEIFLNKLYRLLEEQGALVSKPPLLGCKEVNLYKLYQLVIKNGGMEEVTNLSKWRSIYIEMGLTNPPTTASYNMRNFYKRYLYPYEALERGIDTSDEQTNPETEKESEKESEKTKKAESDSDNENQNKRITRMQSKNESDSEVERRETRSSRPRRTSLEKSFPPGRSIVSSTESSDESTSSSAELEAAVKRDDHDVDSDQAKHSSEELVDIVNSPQSSILSEKDFSDAKSESEVTLTEDGRYPIGARVLVKYGKGKTHRAYEAKIIDAEQTPELFYYVHYRGWNHRYDEWIKHDIITGLSPTPSKKKNGNNSKNSPSSAKYKHDTPPGAHGVLLNSPVSKQRGSSPASKQPALSPSSAKHRASSPSSRQRANSPPLTSRQTSRSSQRKSSPPPLQPAPSPTPVSEKPGKSTQNNPKPSQPLPKLPNVSQKVTSAPAKMTNTQPKQSHAQSKTACTQPKPAHTQTKPASLSKSAYTTPKVEPTFPDIKAHPIKPRTTRNSMQDVFLITALEESISAKGSNSRRKNSPTHAPDSPSSEIASQRSRRAKDKPNPSPIPEEEESDSSSAKEDDVEMPEQNRTPQQKKSNRRKRKDRSPFEKADSKESGEEDEPMNEYRAEYRATSWRERNKNSLCDKFENKPKNEAKRREKTKTQKQRLGNAKNKLSDDNKNQIPEDSEIRPMGMLGVEEILAGQLAGSNELQDKSIDVINYDAVKKRRNDQPYNQERHVDKERDKMFMKMEMLDEDSGQTITEESNSPVEYNDECKEEVENKSTVGDCKIMDGENNNMKQNLTNKLPSTDEIIGMERVVDILQQAAAINAEKERNLERVANAASKSDVKSSPASFATPEKDRERRKKRKERKRRKRAISCTLVDASESENSQQSPLKSNKESNQSLDKEKFDFVSDLAELGNLEASERIQLLQGRIYEIQKLYGKLKTELASIERRKRRKLRKQGETSWLSKHQDSTESKPTITR